MFTPKWSNHITLEDETVHTGTQSPEFIALCHGKRSPLNRYLRGRETECEINERCDRTTVHIFTTAASRAGVHAWGWGTATARGPAPCPCGQLVDWEVRARSRCGIEAKRERNVERTKGVPMMVPSAWTGGLDRQLWAPAAPRPPLGSGPGLARALRATRLSGVGQTSSSRDQKEKEKEKKNHRKKDLSENGTSLQE